MQKWEYKKVESYLYPFKKIEELGKEGWELVNVLPINSKHDVGFYFKREVIDDSLFDSICASDHADGSWG